MASPIFGFNEAAGVAAFSAICAWASHVRPGSKQSRIFMKKYNNSMWFGLNWLLYSWVMEAVLLTITLFYFAQNTPGDSWNLIAGLVLFMVHLFGLRMRNMYMWKLRNPRYALLSGWSMQFLTAVGFYICMLVENIQGLYYVPVITFTIYVAFFLLTSLGWFGGIYTNWFQAEVGTSVACGKNAKRGGFRMWIMPG